MKRVLKDVLRFRRKVRARSSKSERPFKDVKYVVLSHLKSNARARGFEWVLTDEQTFNLIEQNCFYCGAPPLNENAAPAYYHSGLDRKDNSLGYTIDNVVPCCVSCNSSKSNGSFDLFLKRRSL